MALIRGNGGLNIRICVRDPEKAHPCAEPRVLAYFASKSVYSGLGCSELQEPLPPKKNGEKTRRVNTFGEQSHACAEKKPLGAP